LYSVRRVIHEFSRMWLMDFLACRLALALPN
jgi:hypothetical protein